MTISVVMPSQVAPDGVQVVTITGTGFDVPVRVYLDRGDGANPIEVPVLSVTPTRFRW